MSKSYNRLDKDQAAVLLVDHQAGLLSLVRDLRFRTRPIQKQRSDDAWQEAAGGRNVVMGRASSRLLIAWG